MELSIELVPALAIVDETDIVSFCCPEQSSSSPYRHAAFLRPEHGKYGRPTIICFRILSSNMECFFSRCFVILPVATDFESESFPVLINFLSLFLEYFC